MAPSVRLGSSSSRRLAKRPTADGANAAGTIAEVGTTMSACIGERPQHSVAVSHFKEVDHKFGRWLDLVFLQRFLYAPGSCRR